MGRCIVSCDRLTPNTLDSKEHDLIIKIYCHRFQFYSFLIFLFSCRFMGFVGVGQSFLKHENNVVVGEECQQSLGKTAADASAAAAAMAGAHAVRRGACV